MIVLASACSSEPSYVHFDADQVQYAGEPYGDFIVVADAVRDCMRTDKPTLPHLILIDGMLECYTSSGWHPVVGCTVEEEVWMVTSVVRDTGGQLWAHELTHYFGNGREDDPCGLIGLENFSLELPDGGVSPAP